MLTAEAQRTQRYLERVYTAADLNPYENLCGLCASAVKTG
jgi:hypothetical protein